MNDTDSRAARIRVGNRVILTRNEFVTRSLAHANRPTLSSRGGNTRRVRAPPLGAPSKIRTENKVKFKKKKKRKRRLPHAPLLNFPTGNRRPSDGRIARDETR